MSFRPLSRPLNYNIRCESAAHVYKQLNHNYQGIFVAFLKHGHRNDYKLNTRGFYSVF